MLFLVIAAIVPARISQGQAGARTGRSGRIRNDGDGTRLSVPQSVVRRRAVIVLGLQPPVLLAAGAVKSGFPAGALGQLERASLERRLFRRRVNGGPLIEDWVGTTTGFIGGWRLGWDFDPAWGGEMRMAFGSPSLYDSYRADRALTLIDNTNGLATNDPVRARYDHREASMFQWDVDILYYPWGETRLRPYFSPAWA